MMKQRFAPSPTGFLHLGHAYSAALGWMSAREQRGQFVLRIEDLDIGRCRPVFYDAIDEDLGWLGIGWDDDVLCQTSRMTVYDDALVKLQELGILYRCTCTRKDIQAAISAPQEGAGLDGPVYPGTCRDQERDTNAQHALRLNLHRAIEHLGGFDAVASLRFNALLTNGRPVQKQVSPTTLLETAGDVVLRRKDGAPAYHLAVVVDDAFQQITHVTRGADLEATTPLHRLLQELLGLPAPIYHHHDLIRDSHGKRLAKRDDALSLRALRANGVTPAEIFEQLGLTARVSELSL